MGNGIIYYDKKHLYRDTDFRGKKNAFLDTWVLRYKTMT